MTGQVALSRVRAVSGAHAVSRRGALTLALGALAAAVVPQSALAALDAAVAGFTGGAAAVEAGGDGIVLTMPELAENGNAVPVTVSAPGAVAVMILATANPFPDVCKARFGRFSTGSFTTRIRMAATQEVIALAEMPDGRFLRTSRMVPVTVGGCAE